MQEEISLECKLRVYVDTKPFLGMGRVELLAKIHQLGSISKAASSMNMSYRKAWQLVNDMNTISNQPLVIKQTGGKTGGGAVLTTKGIEIIKQYHQMQKKLDIFLAELKKGISI